MSLLLNPVLLLASLMLGAGWALAAATWPPGMILVLPLSAATLAYPYSVLAAIADHRPPPVASALDFNPANHFPRIFHGAIWSVSCAALGRNPAFWPLLPLLIVMAPASMAVMASTGSVSASLYPPGLVRLIRTLGLGYLVPVTCLAIVVWLNASGWMVRLQLPAMVVAVHALLLSAATTGQVVYRRRMRLDLPFVSRAERIAESRRREHQRVWAATMSEVYRHMSVGEIEAGWALLRGSLERDGNSLAGYQQAYETLREWKLPDQLASFARRYIERLIAAGQLQRALEVTEERLRHDSSFTPLPGSIEALVKYADDVGHEATAGLLRRTDPPTVVKN